MSDLRRATAVVFPGQGAQRAGMGAPWLPTASWSLVARMSEHAGVDLAELLLRTGDDALRRTDLAQLAVFSVSVVALHEAGAAGVLADAVAYAGHSLGEYTAMYAAGVLTLQAAVRLVKARGEAMRDAAAERPGTMAVVMGLAAERVEELAAAGRARDLPAWVANLNAPGQVVVSGAPDGIAHLSGLAVAAGAKIVAIPVGGAFHCPMMAPAARRFAAALRAESFADRHAPIVTNADAAPVTGTYDWRSGAVRQMTGPVLWERSVRSLMEVYGCRRFVEVGPGRALSGLCRRISRDVGTVLVRGPEDLMSPSVQP